MSGRPIEIALQELTGMDIPFLDLRKINAEIEEDIKRAVDAVISSGWYILGKSDEQFEAALKHALCGDDEGYAVGCNSGTDALQLSLLAAGVNPGDEVITVSHTAIPTVSAICSVRAKPMLVDIDAHTWVMDIDCAIRAITDRTRAIIPVHLYGNMVEMERLRLALRVIGREDIAVIEDVAQAHGATLLNRQAGTLGRFGAFSFYPSKNIGALGDGGAVFCANKKDKESLKMLRNYGQKDRYNAEVPRGINSRLDEIQAAILTVKLRHLNKWNERKRTMMETYRKELTRIPVTFQKATQGCNPAWHLCVIAMENAAVRKSLSQHLAQDSIQTLIHYPIPTHKQKAFAGDGTPMLPVTEDFADRILSIPLNTSLTQEEQTRVIESIRTYFN